MTLTISPSGVVGVPDEDVEFSVESDPVIDIVSYAWTFSGGATPSTSSSATPTVTLGDPGTYTVGLTISDGTNMHLGGGSFTVAGVPVITAVTPSGEVGLPSGDVQFTALTELPDATSWLWQFQVGGEEPVEFDVAQPILTLPNAGDYTGTVIATNSLGSSGVVAFSFSVGVPVAPTWTVQELGPCLGSDPVGHNLAHSIVTGLVYEGKLVLAYTAPGGLTIRRALTELPASPEDWEEHLLDAEGFVAGVHTLTVHKGKLALLYQRRFGTPSTYPAEGTRMCLAWADNPEPDSAGDWAIHDIEAGYEGMVFSSLASINDEYLLGITRRFGNRILVSNEEPVGAEDWTIYNIPEEWPRFPGEYSARFLQRDESICVAASNLYPTENFTFGVDFYQTTTSPPLAATDWEHTQVAVMVGAYSEVGLWPADEGWAFAVCTSAIDKPAIQVHHTPLPEPTSSSDWSIVPLEGPIPASLSPGAEVVVGRAAIAYFDNDNQQLRLARQVTTGIGKIQDWKRTTVTGVIGDEHAFWVAPLILELDGRIAMFWCEPVSRRLRFALADSNY